MNQDQTSHGAAAMLTPPPNKPVAVCALYKFTTLKDFQQLRDPLLQQLEQDSIRGTLLLAQEGINGTIAGRAIAIQNFLEWLGQDSRFSNLDYKISWHAMPPFHRTKVKLKKEIVTMGVVGIDPNKLVGAYVEPTQWNALIGDPDTLLIDTRNDYEVQIGSFSGAVNPNTRSFREFPKYVENNLDNKKHQRVAMFCTGGIRCEKASAYMKQQGFDQVFHLHGGILNYFAHVKPEESLWQGECFVFDDRVAVNHHLEKGAYDQCHACRYPITDVDKSQPQYVPGVSCPRCYESLTEAQKQRFAERQKQVQLARSRGEQHIGSDSRVAAEGHRQQKIQRRQQQNKPT